MKIIKPDFELCINLTGAEILEHIERCGRVCYKSEDKITETSAPNFIRSIIKRGHESVLEHASVTAKITTDRGVTHEIVRHRIASYSQESTRYCNYSSGKFGNEITVVPPTSLEPGSSAYTLWEVACKNAETTYFLMLESGCTPQIARSVLPNSLKAEIMMTANLREWRHFFALRCSAAAHPSMREVALIGLRKMHEAIPVVFDDLANQYLIEGDESL